MKYFQFEGHQLRLLPFDESLTKFNPAALRKKDFSGMPLTAKEGKPDNSGENCNLFVKGVPYEWTD
tara:strand:+ start:420 stop:617 length:198 start_codon:yes stop_codon:yes gene_type:complete